MIDWSLPKFTFGAPLVDSIWVVLPLTRPEYLPAIGKNLARQTFPHHLIVVAPEGIDVSLLAPDRVVRGAFGVGAARRAGVAAAPEGAYVVSMDDDDWYGPDYLREHASLAKVGRIVGKQLHFVSFEGTDAIALLRPHIRDVSVTFLAGGTIGGFTQDLDWRDLECSEDMDLCSRVRSSGGEVWHSSIYQVLYQRRADPISHTYKANPWTIVAFQGGHWFRRFPRNGFEKLVCGEIPESGDWDLRTEKDLIPIA